MQSRICPFLPALFAVFLASSAYSAVVHGTVYNWETLEPLPNVIVEVSSAPKQSMVSADGSYEFTLPVGIYALRAIYAEGGRVAYTGEEQLAIAQDGNYVLDIIAFTPIDEDTELSEMLSDDLGADVGAFAEMPQEGALYLTAALAAVILAVIFFWHMEKRRKKAKHIGAGSVAGAGKSAGAEMPAASGPVRFSTLQEKALAEAGPAAEKLDDSAKKLLSVLQRSGGRMTQKDLRARVDFGEAQTSLILTELESLGHVKKIKKGRGNIIILKKQPEKNESRGI